MNQWQRKFTIATLGILTILLGAGSLVGPVAAHNVASCSVTNPTGTVNIVSGGSAVVSVSVTYNSFSSTDGWPMTVSASSITSGFSANTSTFTGTGPTVSSGTHVFHLLITNTNTAVTSGSATLIVKWDGGELSASCGTIQLKTFSGPPPPGVPQFPYGIAALMAVAIPALLVAKSKYTAVVKQ